MYSPLRQLHAPVDVGRAVIYHGILGGKMVITLTQNTRDVGLIPL